MPGIIALVDGVVLLRLERSSCGGETSIGPPDASVVISGDDDNEEATVVRTDTFGTLNLESAEVPLVLLIAAEGKSEDEMFSCYVRLLCTHAGSNSRVPGLA